MFRSLLAALAVLSTMLLPACTSPPEAGPGASAPASMAPAAPTAPAAGRGPVCMADLQSCAGGQACCNGLVCAPNGRFGFMCMRPRS